MLAIDIKNTFDQLANIKGKRLPVRMSLAIARNYRMLRDICDDIDESRIDIIRRYAEKDESGEVKTNDLGHAVLKNECVDDLSKDMDELYSSDIDIELAQINIEDVEKCDLDKFDSLSVDEMSAIECMICENGGDISE